MSTVPQIDVHQSTIVAGDGPRDPDTMLIAFVRERDISCPRCGYNLRNLARPVCPECKEALKLQIGVEKIRVLWLFVTLAPGAFCAVALGIMGAMLGFMAVVYGELPSEPLPIQIILTLCFFVASALFMIGLARWHRRFLLLPASSQFIWACATWAAHIMAFVLFLLNVD